MCKCVEMKEKHRTATMNVLHLAELPCSTGHSNQTHAWTPSRLMNAIKIAVFSFIYFVSVVVAVVVVASIFDEYLAKSIIDGKNFNITVQIYNNNRNRHILRKIFVNDCPGVKQVERIQFPTFANIPVIIFPAPYEVQTTKHHAPNEIDMGKKLPVFISFDHLPTPHIFLRFSQFWFYVRYSIPLSIYVFYNEWDTHVKLAQF